jgi:rhodanese-related sulfurtransferase
MLQINQSDLEIWLHEGKQFRLVDVREEWEHHDHNIGGELIPLSELMTEFKITDMEIPVVFYCRKGIRSQIAIQRLQVKFPDMVMYNLEGGIG